VALALDRVAEVMPLVLDARRVYSAQAVVESAAPGLGPSPHVDGRIRTLAAEYERLRRQIHEGLRQTPDVSNPAASRLRRLLVEEELAPAEFLQHACELYSTLLRHLVVVAIDAEGWASNPAGVLPGGPA
jgi:hypothetical protein